MGFLKLLAVSLLSLHAVRAAEVPIADVDDDVNAPSTSPNLAVQISASFPAAEVFGVKLINGHATQAVLSVSNNEPEAITVAAIGGSLWKVGIAGQPPVIVRNFTATRYNLQVPAGEQETVVYNFKTELHPQDLLLTLGAGVLNTDGDFYNIPAFNGTVSIVEAPTSIFDPQIIFLYLILAALFGGTSYYIYNTWVASLFAPQNKRRTPGGDKNARNRGIKKPEPADQIPVEGADGPAVTTGSKGYDASWIPEHHIKRPEAKRLRSGTPSGVKVKSRAA